MELVGLQFLSQTCWSSTQESLDTDKQLRSLERLGEIIVGACLESLNLVLQFNATNETPTDRRRIIDLRWEFRIPRDAYSCSALQYR
jgi:hypothetical protein